MAAFRKFNQDALDAYVTWVKNSHQTVITLIDVPPMPPFVQMLAGTPDAFAADKKGNSWPVMVKKIWQSAFQEPKTVEQIAHSRDNFYIEQGQDNGWRVRKDTALYFACQNITMVYGSRGMDLILFNERNNDILVVNFVPDVDAFKANVTALEEFLRGK